MDHTFTIIRVGRAAVLEVERVEHELHVLVRVLLVVSREGLQAEVSHGCCRLLQPSYVLTSPASQLPMSMLTAPKPSVFSAEWNSTNISSKAQLTHDSFSQSAVLCPSER